MTPIPLSSAINTAGGEDSPFVMPDGNTLYFFFTPNVSVPADMQLLDGVTGIWVSRKQNNTWSKAERIVLQDSGKLALDGAEFVQGDTMWFASAREGYTGVNLFTAEFKNGKWTNWQYVGDKLMKTIRWARCISLLTETSFAFTPLELEEREQLDTWVTRKVDGEWQQPENIEAVNTAENEGWPFISQD